VGVSRDCPNFLKYPLLSRERVKLRTSNLAGIFISQVPSKKLKILEKREHGHIHGLPKVFKRAYPLLSQERVKLRSSNFVRTFIRSITTKAQFQKPISGKVAVGVEGLPKFFRASMGIGRIARSSLR